MLAIVSRGSSQQGKDRRQIVWSTGTPAPAVYQAFDLS